MKCSTLHLIVLSVAAFLTTVSCSGTSETRDSDSSNEVGTTTQTGEIDRSVPTDTSLDFDRNVRSTDPLSPEEERARLLVPPGFEVQLYAAEPDISKPINMAFDEQGRLWVTQSQEYPFPAREGAGDDRITILEDTNGDGRADEFSEFAGGLNIPIAVMPVPGGAVGYSIPYIYRFFDTDGDDRSDHRVALYGRFNYDRDTHGMVNNMTRGFDGRIDVCHGFNNRSEVPAPNGETVVLDGGSTFEISLGGDEIERTTTGRVNPFGMSYDHLGYLYSVDCHSQPIYQLIPGADYPQFGKSPSGIGFGPRMMRRDHDHGPTAISGAVYYDAPQFPAEFRDNFFSGNVVSSRVNRDVIVREGSTPVARHTEDFIVSEDPWFRPVDLAIGPDGALYVADFYNRIIGHYEVPLDHPGRDRRRGRIWRIVHTGDDTAEPTAPREDWSTAGTDQLLDDLGHPNLQVRMLASEQLVHRLGRASIEPVRTLLDGGDADTLQTVHGLWVLRRLDSLDDARLAGASAHENPAVRTHALRIVRDHTTLDSLRRGLVLEALTDPSPHVRRVAASAAARHPAPVFLEPLIALLEAVPDPDTHLRHGARIALRNQVRTDSIRRDVLARSWGEPSSRALADVMVGVDDPEAGLFLIRHLETFAEEIDAIARYLEHAGRWAPRSEVYRLPALGRARAGDLEDQLQLFRALRTGLAQRSLEPTGPTRAWGRRIAGRLLETPDLSEDLRTGGIELARELGLTGLGPDLAGLIRAAEQPASVRSAAARALAELVPRRASPLLRDRLLDGSEGIALRRELVPAMARAGGASAPERLSELLPSVPYDVQVEIGATLAGSDAGAIRLLDAVEAESVPAQLLVERSVSERLDQRSSDTLQERRNRLTAGVEPIDEALQSTIQNRITGFASADVDSARGAQVYAAYCASCHETRDRGTSIAPQLDGVGLRGLESLVVHTLDPNRTVADQFRYRTVRLENGEVFEGLPQRREGDLLVFVDAAGRERSVPVDEIADQTVSENSLMPSDFARTIPEEEFYDLVAYLLSRR